MIAFEAVRRHHPAAPGLWKRVLREAELGKILSQAKGVRAIGVDALLVYDEQVNDMDLVSVEGKHLRQRLRDSGTTPETVLREITLQTAAGLSMVRGRERALRVRE